MLIHSLCGMWANGTFRACGFSPLLASLHRRMFSGPKRARSRRKGQRQTGRQRMVKKHKPKHKTAVQFENDPDAIFIVVDGVRVAKRGEPGSPLAKTWVSLEPGWEVFDGPDDGDGGSIVIKYDGVRVH